MDQSKALQSRNPDIRYINPLTPDVHVPDLDRESYTDTVPDTLDLAERARHAVHGMTEMTDPDANHELYWAAQFGMDRPLMFHDLNDWIEYKFYGPVAMLRTACGSEENRHVDWHRMVTLRQMQGPDGLLYEPVIGRPWSTDWGFGGSQYQQEQGEHYAGIAMAGRQIEAALVFWTLTGDETWREFAKRIALGAVDRLIDKGDYGYYPGSGVFTPKPSPKDGPEPPHSVNHVGAWTALGATSLYRMTGFEPALDLARKLARFFVTRSGIIEPDGDFGVTHSASGSWHGIHFHTNTLVRGMLLDVGLASDDQELIELAQLGYQFGKKHGDTSMGYFQEFHKQTGGYGCTCEICEVADMLYLALRQSTAGLADCWDDVDRWVRNIFTEGQVLDASWADEYAESFGNEEVHPHACYDRIPERVRGVWAGWITPNQLQGHPKHTIMNCCTGNAALQLYRVWRDMARFEPETETLRVNLLLNKALPEADVHSWLPNRGHVEVKPKRDCAVAIRIPEWAETSDCSFALGGAVAQPSWDGRYGIVKAHAGQTVALDCPVPERTEKRSIMYQDWTLTVRGNTIVDVDPAGRWGKIHHRPECRTEGPPLVRRERCVHSANVEI